MDAARDNFNYFFVFVLTTITWVHAVPPEACFANFRWDDCGHPPTPVMYYWKPGSRCEVGIWRGCLPNLNMFHDEYECINTCIFSARAQPEDYHNHIKMSGKNEEKTLKDKIYSKSTQSQNATGTEAGDSNETETGEADDADSTTLAEGTEGEETTEGGGEEAPPEEEAAPPE